MEQHVYLIKIILLDLIIIYQFLVWFGNALKNVGWFEGATAPIVGVGVVAFILVNLLVINEVLTKWCTVEEWEVLKQLEKSLKREEQIKQIIKEIRELQKQELKENHQWYHDGLGFALKKLEALES